MTQLLKDILKEELDIENYENIEVVKVKLDKLKNELNITIKNDNILKFNDFYTIKEKFQNITNLDVHITGLYNNSELNTQEVIKYINFFSNNNLSLSIFNKVSIISDKDNLIKLVVDNENNKLLSEDHLDDLLSKLNEIGIHDYSFIVEMSKPLDCVVNSVEFKELPKAKETNETNEKHNYQRRTRANYGNNNKGEIIKLNEVKYPMNNVEFYGKVYDISMNTIKSGKQMQKFYISDNTDMIPAVRFESDNLSVEEMESLSGKKYYHFKGRIQEDDYNKCLAFYPRQIEEAEEEVIVDDALEKRIEFHMHSNMSEMDGICNIKDIVNYFWNLGHEGFILTDHIDVQSYVKGFNAIQGLKKKNPDRKFKMGYGVEMNMCEDELTIVRNGNDNLLDNQEFVIFDLETTGLSAHFDHIIEFGGVKVKNHTIIDRKQMFIKPPIDIPTFITAKTNITNDMVKNALTFEEAYKEIIDWIGDAALVAHNATFDYYFLNEELKKVGAKPLTNPIIDTLDLARAILKSRSQFRLGVVARAYKIDYDEETAHRADYDAEVLYSVFMELLKDAREKSDVKTINDLQTKTQNEKSFHRIRPSHVCVVAKNQQGIYDVYKAVSASYTDYLAILGKQENKSSGKERTEPRIKRSYLKEHRDNVLIGSACLNGEIFELAANGNQERLEEAMKFYDYIEVQPLANYSILLVTNSVPSEDRLKDIIRRIIDTARSLDIPVIADSDAHYLYEYQKAFREVIINNTGVGGATHPLYIFNADVRQRTSSPDQHVRLTKEMLVDFSWLNDPDLVKEIVIDNPKKIFDSIDDVRPIPEGVFPPHIEGGDDKLREVCYKKVKEVYEFNGKVPNLVMNRLNEELDNIIKHGFGVHYYIAHILVKKSHEDGYVVGSRGSVGSSFAATMAGFTEVNPLRPHYICPHCHYSDWEVEKVKSGIDLPDKECPHCGNMMKGEGQDIPFQTFLGFEANKTPDIDLNFSNEYQHKAHAFIREVFGEKYTLRAGTIQGVQEQTSYGMVKDYCEKKGILNMTNATKLFLSYGIRDIKKTTGQHPGGIIIIPEPHDYEDFTPVQFPANNPDSDWKTSHYDYHDIADNVLKFDILGHVDPTAMRLLESIAEVKPSQVPLNDPETLSLFNSDAAIKADPRIYKKETAALGLPEFGTRTTRAILEETRPTKFSDLVIISGISHGEGIWKGNAQDLFNNGIALSEVIGCRDDIMTYLLSMNLEPADAFSIMEDVRKGRGLTAKQEQVMKEHNVPDWYIESAKKIKYMFPKAHAVAYVTMAVRIAWYKVHDPMSFYIQFFSLRCSQYDIEAMTSGIKVIREKMEEAFEKMNDRSQTANERKKFQGLYTTLEVCEEYYARGYKINKVDINKSKAKTFIIDPDDPKALIPPFVVVDGLGETVAESIEEAREQASFLSKQDLSERTQLSNTTINTLDKLGALGDLPESNQISLFD